MTRVDSQGPKFRSLHALLMTQWSTMAQYEYIWLPDDDLRFQPGGLSTLFRLARRHDLKLCQASLAPDSFVSHSITLHHPAFAVRFTDYVETMAPCFRVDALRLCLATFPENVSGWGVDYLWTRVLRDTPGRMGVVDAVQMWHTRPAGGPHHALCARNGMSAFAELLALLDKHHMEPIQRCTGGIAPDGSEYDPVACARALERSPFLPWGLPG